MYKKIIFLSILLAVLFAGTGMADPIATARFDGGFTSQFEFTVRIFLKSDTGVVLPPPIDITGTDFNLGSTALAIDFDETVLVNPVLDSPNPTFHANGALYDNMVLDTGISGRVRLLVNPSIGSAGEQVPTQEFLLAKIIFAVVPANASSNSGLLANDGDSFMLDIAGPPSVFLSWSGDENRSMTCAPDIEGTPAATAVVGAPYSFIPTEIDVCSPPDYTATALPAWATLNPATGELSGTPAPGDFATFTGIQITATDIAGSDSIPPFDIDVTCTVAPTLSGTPVTSIAAGNAYSFAPTVSDGCGTFTFSIQNQPGWASFDTGTGALTGTPALSDAGTTTGVAISIQDQNTNGDDLTPFDLEVTANCVAPVISGTPGTSATVNSAYTFTPTVSNGCGTLTYAVQNLPAWMSFDSATGTLSGTPAQGDIGTSAGIVITVTDIFSANSALAVFDIDVSASLVAAGGGGGGGGGGGCFIETLGGLQ